VSVAKVDPPSAVGLVGIVFVRGVDGDAERELDVGCVKPDWDVCAFCVGVADEDTERELDVSCARLDWDVCTELLSIVVAVVGPALMDAGTVVLVAAAVSAAKTMLDTILPSAAVRLRKKL
jgi:hypothetical protein